MLPFRELLNLGTPDVAGSETQRIRTTNLIALVASFISVFYTLTFLVLDWQLLALFDSFFILWYGSILLWNRRGHTRLAPILMLFGGLVQLTVIPLGFVGPAGGIQFFLLVIPVFSFVTVHIRQVRWTFVLTALSAVSMGFIELQRADWVAPWPTTTDETVLAALGSASMVIATALCLVVLSLVQQDVRDARSSLKTANAQLSDNVEQERRTAGLLSREARGRIESQQYFLEHLARIAGLSRLSELSAKQSSEEALLRNCSLVAGRITGAEQVELLLVDATNPGLQLLVLHGSEEEHSLHGPADSGSRWRRVPAEALPWLQTLLRDGRLVVNKSKSENGPWAESLRMNGFGSGMVMPVVAGQATLGVLTIGARFEDHFDSPAQNIVGEFASTIGSNLGLMRAMRALETNLDQADSVLTSVLPDAVTSRLKRGESQIADRIPLAGVFFCDLAGFTAYASEADPEEVVAMLQSTFGLLEEACARHGVEKIKTIGDAFMAVTGVSLHVDQPVEVIAEFALDAATLLRQHLTENDVGLGFRIGLHAGPVLAGVIGSDRLFFDIWGDTVNVASRLESSAAPGEIRCSGDIREALGAGWTFVDCGFVPLKGKGEQQVWALTGHDIAGGSLKPSE
ncbi:MAG TPA: hypothetical protein DIU15_03965 [Deltaproteobacteria bacterium]|nr:hypothetical protein [Deltaproteobacteria bacterium]